MVNTRLAFGFSVVLLTMAGQTLDPRLWQGLQWRCIGPFRAGRTVGAAGVRGQPNVFFAGVNNGGVWKTDDAGRTWKPIFDDQPTGSIGDIAVAPSDPNVIYVGSGEGLQRPDLSTGDGVYKSADGGKTWRNTGLHDAQQIGWLAVDPKDANRVFVAALGHPYGPNAERGVFRSTDGGTTWKKVLYKDEDTGAIQVEIDPNDSQIVYADLWAGRQGPWENGQWQGPGSGLYKSTDGGDTWRQLTTGLPTIPEGLGRIGIGIAPGNPKVIYATVDADPKHGGVYRSDDGGENWRLLTQDARLWGRGSDFAEIKAHPKNPDTVYVANTSTYVSYDGGKTWAGFKGAPGGDDYHRIWINPDEPDIMLFAADQGATITVNGGKTWSSWYNQPTAQFYHVSTDNQFPYWVYGGQQESGSAGVASRGDYGAITWRDWRTVGVEEYGYVAPDPLDSNIIYGGKLTRFDKRTGQVQSIAPEVLSGGKYRWLRTAPVLFSPVNPHVLYYAGNVLFRTSNGGHSWDVISPDLSRERPDVPENIGRYRTPELANMARRGVIYTVAPSFQDERTIWAGTDDGLIHLTRDGGKTWRNVTPPDLTAWSKVSLMEASHFDNDTAYAAVNRFRLDDLKPHVYRTHDGGKTWKQIVAGIPADEVVNAVREDPKRKGLLYAGTEKAVYFSTDDGEHWYSLRRNMPATSIRDVVVHEDDLVAGTHGRSFWILDDVTPLRQIGAQTASADAVLFAPQVAYRMRRSVNTDTPIPPEEPMGQNPPDGAILNYWLKGDATVVLEILDATQKVVRRYSSEDQPDRVDPKTQPYPTYWFRPARVVPGKAGMQRWVWDLRYAPPTGFARSYPISAINGDTPPDPLGPLARPGAYTVKLTVNGKSYTQPLTLKIDPRVVTPANGIIRMFELAMQAYESIGKVRGMQAEMQTIREKLPQGELETQIAALQGKSAAVGRRRRGANTATNLSSLADEFLSLLDTLEGADATPTVQAENAARELQTRLADAASQWQRLKAQAGR